MVNQKKMKKLWSCFLVMLCIIMIMTGCDSNDPVNEEESNNSEAQSETLVNDETFPPSTPQAPSSQDPPKEDDGVLEIAHHKFYKNSDGKLVVEHWRYPNAQPAQLVETKYFDPVTPTADDFAKIENGMTVFEVVELVGLPKERVTSGAITMDFECEDGRWCIYWSHRQDLVVVDVFAREPWDNAKKAEVGMTYAEVKELMGSDGKQMPSQDGLYEWNLWGTDALYVCFEQPNGSEGLENCVAQTVEIKDKIIL